MSVTLHDQSNLYRVYKKINAVEHQFYFPKTRAGLQAAKTKDSQLEAKQKSKRQDDDLLVNRLFNPDGSIRGLVRKLITRNGGQSIDTFKLQCTVNGKKRSASASIDKHGYSEAFDIVLYKLKGWYKFRKGSKVDIRLWALKK